MDRRGGRLGAIIQYFGMWYKMDGGLMRHVSNEDKLSCELCQNVHSDIYYCNLCCLFCCSACTQSHQCPNQPLQGTLRFQKIEIDNKISIDLCKKLSEGGHPPFTQLSSGKSEWSRSCMRCLLTPATKHCISCKIKYYCDPCFKSVHGGSKTSTHNFEQVRQNREKTSSIIKCQLTKLTKTHTVKENSRLNAEDCRSNTDRSDHFFQNMETNLHLLRKTILSEYSSYEKEVNESIGLISNSFDHLIEETKLKLFEITMKIRENAKNTLSKLEQIKQCAASQQKLLANLRYLHRQEEQLIPIDIFQNKKNACQCQINQLIVLAQLSVPKDQVDKRLIDLSQQIDLTRIKIQKIQLKKGGLHADKMYSPKISSSNNTSRNEKNTNSFKSPLNMPGFKSNEKLNISLVTPKSTKPRKQYENTVNKSLFLKQAVINSPEDQLEKSFKSTKALYFDSKKKLEKNKSQNDIRFLTTLISPKASIKKFERNMDSNAKSKILKTGINIEKTKKMITQIRNEMIQFTTGYHNDKEPSLISPTERHILDNSQTSMQSEIDKSLKL